MIRFLIYRPIAVLVTTLSLVILGSITFTYIPVSLLPDIPIPEITVQINYPTASAKELNQTITKPILNQLQQINHLEDLEAESRDGLASIKLHFNFRTDINLAYIEANEKIDGIIGSLPKDLERPLVIKAGATDIPVFNLNVYQKTASSNEENFIELSNFCDNVLKRRIEQLSEVALVDITGISKEEVLIIPNQSIMQSLHIEEQELTDILQKNNIDLGNFVIKDGQYQYNIRFSSILKTTQDIENIYFKKENRLLQIKDIAKVLIKEQKLKGVYNYNGSRAICLSIIKQSDTQILNLQKKLNSEILKYKADYPQLSFAISQDQTELLNLSINNLAGNILFGAFCTFVLVFFFMNNFKTPIIIGLVIPVSLIITFLCFFLFHISINVVSLAGLVLGIGEIIDSAIIVIENIEQQQEEGHDLENSIILGTEEVIVPLFTSIVTNSAVFLPLIFMSGIAGTLFFDQAVSVSLSLSISLLCSYTLVPVLYRLFFLKQNGPRIQKNTFLTTKTEQAYDWLFDRVFLYKKSYLAFFLVIGISIFLLFLIIDKQGMPSISHRELEAKIDWNEPISAQENQKRIKELLAKIRTKTMYHCSFIGQQQFILHHDLQQNLNESKLFIKVESNNDFEQLKNEINDFLKQKFPQAVSELNPAKNIFEQLFNTTHTSLRLMVTSTSQSHVPDIGEIYKLHDTFIKNEIFTNLPAIQNRIYIRIRPDKLLLYNVNYETVYQKLKTVFNDNIVGNLKSEQKYIPILIGNDTQETTESINNVKVPTNENNYISLNQVVEFSKSQDYKSYFQGKEGNFVVFDINNLNIHESEKKIRAILQESQGLNGNFYGSFFKNQILIKELFWVLLVAICLLYFILSAQFESLIQPFIVIITIAFALFGSLFLLWVNNQSLNIMSLIGMVVLMGILDNDSILKIDTMNRSINKMSLVEVIKLSGKRRLKSQLMTFLTTILGLLPTLFSFGLGAELQRPLAFSVIGGMCFGLFTSLSFIPLVYWIFQRKK